MQTCNYCGSAVTDAFVRVFGFDSGEVFACPNCTANVGIAEVAMRRARET
jgi:hypothetical protein